MTGSTGSSVSTCRFLVLTRTPTRRSGAAATAFGRTVSPPRNGYSCAENIDTDEDIAAKFAVYHKVWKETHPGGEPGRTFLMRQVYVDDTDEKAHEARRLSATRGAREPRADARALRPQPSRLWRRRHPGDRQRERVRKMMAGENGYEWALENGIFIVGSPETVVASVQRTAQRMGGLDVFSANFEFGRMPLNQARRSLRMFGEHVLPEVSKIPVPSDRTPGALMLRYSNGPPR